MPFRVSVLDLTAAIVVLVVIALPDRSLRVVEAYQADRDQQRAIALYQARLAENAGDAEAAAVLSNLLIDAKQSDWAVQVAAEAAARNPDDPWRALLAVSMAHAERVEVDDAYKYAALALEQCRQAGSLSCPRHEEVRLNIYHGQLEAGAQSGIDPRVDPRGYEKAVFRTLRMIQFRGATPREDGDGTTNTDVGTDGSGAPAPAPTGEPAPPAVQPATPTATPTATP